MCIDKYILSNDPKDKAIGIALLKIRFQKPYEEVWYWYHELIDNKALDPIQFPYSYSLNPTKFIVSSLVKQLCEDIIPKLENDSQEFTKEQINKIFDEALSRCL